MNELEQFLSRNTIFDAGMLPLVHSTKAYHLKSISNKQTLVASHCDVFTPDRLNYFFVGRPAYKADGSDGESAYWEHPCCFIFEFDALSDIRRIYPFDSGAFHHKLYPKYIRMMPRDAFEVSSIPNAAGRIVGAFFGTTQRYLDMRPKGHEEFVEEYALAGMDMELKALHRLSLERNAASFDDRRLTIEVQSGADVDLRTSHPLAVIAPSEYFDEPSFRRKVEIEWGAVPISYSVAPLNVANSYGQIYEKVREFYRVHGFI